MPTHYPHNADRPGDAAPPSFGRRAPVQWWAAPIGALFLLFGLGAGPLWFAALGIAGVALACSDVAARVFLVLSAVACATIVFFGG